MKYSEFEKLVKEIDSSWTIEEYAQLVSVVDEDSNNLVCIFTEKLYQIDTTSVWFDVLPTWQRRRLFDCSVALAGTPLEEREDEKRYYVLDNDSYPLLTTFNDSARIRESTRDRDIYEIDSIERKKYYSFTEQEIKNYDSRYWPFAVEVEE